jgi:hypothetical protein
MKKFLILLLAPFLLTVSLAQTQPNLPTGSKPFSSSIFISPNADLWTGKTGVYMNLAKKRYVDSLVTTIDPTVTTAKLKVNTAVTNPEWRRVPAAVANGTDWQNNGLLATYNVGSFESNNALALRKDGRLQVANPIDNSDALNLFHYKYKRDSLQGSDANSFIKNSARSAVWLSENSSINITQTAFPASQNVIINSRASTITSNASDYSWWNTIIGANGCRIGNLRQNSAIIASYNSEIMDGQTSTGKWNSAIIAGLLCKVGASNSYTLVTGRGNESNGSAQFICGRYNLIEPLIGIDNPLRKAFIVGAGQGPDDGSIVRGNAFHVTHGGKAWVKNEMEVDAAGGGLVLKSPDGSRWKITVSNTGTLSTTKLP